VAAANLLGAPLREGRVTTGDLCSVQRRREWPTKLTQQIQIFLQNRFIKRVLSSTGAVTPPLAVTLLARVPFLARLPARLIGMGVRPEHVHSPNAYSV
jgi:hypothetical protein